MTSTSISAPRFRLLGAALFCAVIALTMLVLRAVAHADAGALPLVESGPSWVVYLGIALAAGGGLLKIIDVTLAGLRWLAPRTKTTLDDVARDDLQIVRDHLGEAIAVLTKVVPPAPAPSSSVAKAGTIGVLLLVLTIGAGALTPACSGSSQSSRATTIGALTGGARATADSLRTYEHLEAEVAITKAVSLEDGRVALTALRAKLAPAWKAVDGAFNALAIATTLNDDPSLAGAKAALDQAITAVTTLTGGAK